MDYISNRRVVLIGPVLPYRGGIAQHTTMLHRVLKGRVELKTVSFKKQYPAWLFPGESDRDPDYEGYRENGVEYLLSSLNPLTWRTILRSISIFKPDRVIMPWWTMFWSPCFYYLAHGFRRSGVKVVFFCHNVVEHETSRLKASLARWVIGQGDAFVVHTEADRLNLLTLLPHADVKIHPHPIYDQFPAARGLLPKRADLELLFFGFVRPYKGLDVLIEAVGLLKDPGVFLTIAGEFWEGEDKIKARIDELGLEENIEIVPRYLKEAEIAEYFARSDVVVLPYRSATGSGVVPLAYHYGKPVIVTSVGGLPDVVDEGETGWIVPPEAPSALAAAIMEVTPKAIYCMAPHIEHKKEAMTWDGLAEVIVSC